MQVHHSRAALQVLVGQLDYFSEMPNTMPALQQLCNMPKVLLCLCGLHRGLTVTVQWSVDRWWYACCSL